VPLPLLPVLGACVVDCRLPLLVVELEDDVDAELESVDVVLLSAVLEELDDDLPAYDAAAAKLTPTTATSAPAVAPKVSRRSRSSPRSRWVGVKDFIGLWCGQAPCRTVTRAQFFSSPSGKGQGGGP
jgi:hypothetical protein